MTPKALILLLMISLVLSSCAGIPRPIGDVCGINAHAKELRCYDMEKDFDDNGKRKADAKPHIKPITSLNDLNASVYFDPDSWAEVVRFMGDVREALKQCEGKKP